MKKLRTFVTITAAVWAFLALSPHFAPAAVDLNAGDFHSNQTQEKFVVEKVVSADMIRLDNGERVRLIGLKAPRPPQPAKVEYDERGAVIEKEDPTETVEDQAFEFAKTLLLGHEVRLEYDSQKKDTDFYTLAYVFRADDGTFVNAEILRQGYANLHLIPPNLKYEEKLRSAYQEARQERRGLHQDY